MEARRVGASVRVGGDARQRLYGARGIGRPVGDGEVELTWVEAAYLLERGDLGSVDGVDAAAFISDPPAVGDLARLCAYRDLRERGYYVSPAYHPGDAPASTAVVLLVRPRGSDPTTDEVAHRVVVVGESTDMAVDDLSEATLAIVDDESEVTYAEVRAIDPDGEQDELRDLTITGTLTGDRVLVEDPPIALHHGALFGRPVEEDGATLWLNLLEARHLERRGILRCEGDAALTDR
ncbi:MAG: tRNA-intron lyase, partial [Halobacteriota archaeon]